LRINNIISYVDSKIHGSVNIQYKGFHNSNSISSNSIRSNSNSNSISSSSSSNGISSYKGKDDVVLVPKRYNIVDTSDSSIPIEEVRKNLTLYYIHFIHD
jgi:hypothetical protein